MSNWKALSETARFEGREAAVVVASRIATKAAQTELYRLLLTAEGRKLHDLQVQDEVIGGSPPLVRES